MQVPYRTYFVVRKYKDGHEDTDGREFNTPQEAVAYREHLTTALPKEELETIEKLYVDNATWLYEVK